jgi:hypothetical protein
MAGAHVFVPGHDLDLTRDLAIVKETSDAFHQAISELARPPWMDHREDPWAYGDRMAWGEAQPQGDAATLHLVERLRAASTPVTDPRASDPRRHPS